MYFIKNFQIFRIKMGYRCIHKKCALHTGSLYGVVGWSYAETTDYMSIMDINKSYISLLVADFTYVMHILTRRRMKDLRKEICEKPDEMDRPLGKDGCRQTSKESRGGQTSRTQERGRPQLR